jgi:hypothetical protein
MPLPSLIKATGRAIGTVRPTYSENGGTLEIFRDDMHPASPNAKTMMALELRRLADGTSDFIWSIRDLNHACGDSITAGNSEVYRNPLRLFEQKCRNRIEPKSQHDSAGDAVHGGHPVGIHARAKHGNAAAQHQPPKA